jgi:hypothetical protein
MSAFLDWRRLKSNNFRLSYELPALTTALISTLVALNHCRNPQTSLPMSIPLLAAMLARLK